MVKTAVAVILSDKDIKQHLKEGKIRVEPLDVEDQLKSVCIDLKLGNEFKIFKMDQKSHIDPSVDKFDEMIHTVTVADGLPFILHPNEFVLGVTREYIELSDNIAARIDGRSSLGRMGIIVHSTAGRVDPGYAGKLTLEMSNIGKLPVALYPGMKFCSIVFEPTSSPVERSYKEIGKYVGSKAPEVSKISEEFQKK